MTLPFAKTILVASMILAVASMDEASARKGGGQPGGASAGKPSSPPQQFRAQPLKSSPGPKKATASTKGKKNKDIIREQQRALEAMKDAVK